MGDESSNFVMLCRKEVGRYKHTVFQQYTCLYREYDFIFCGDNGQGDLLAGQLMMQGPDEDRPVAVLIHEVIPLAKLVLPWPCIVLTSSASVSSSWPMSRDVRRTPA
eukprot:g30383.t1